MVIFTELNDSPLIKKYWTVLTKKVKLNETHPGILDLVWRL